jgi:DNA-directed RNA polymerase subunit RPC12/RpoP
MTQYKYQLDKSSKKFNCPKCGKKRFVKYVETETGHYAESQYGRCDRETSCGYSMYPNNNSILSYEYIAPEPLIPSYIEKEILQKTLTKYEINPLTTYLYSHYDEDEVNVTIDKYQVGTSNQFNNSTVFWQMDYTGNIRSGKIMDYDTSTGKRRKNKDGKPLINWVHSVLEIPNYNLKQCLFGLHLLNETTKQVAIVESEKTALIMSIESPNYTWMSTGSLQGFKYEYLAPLKGTDIIAFPDKGGYDKWKVTADGLNKKGFNIEISKLLKNKKYKNGWDLVDVLHDENKK